MDLKAISYNSTGFNFEKANFIKFLMNAMNVDILFLQEHMHLRANLYKIQSHMGDLESFFIPAVISNKVVFAGRPSGGLAIFWRKKLNNCVKMIKHPDSIRVQAIELLGKVIMVNTYFPTDDQSNNVNEFELLKCISEIKWYLERFPHHRFVIAGDLNTDFSRNTRFVNIVRDFFLNYNLVSVWSAFNVDFTFCSHQVRNGNNTMSTSCIDHFILQSPNLDIVSHSQVIHSGDNLSNHEPIFLSITLDTIPDVPNPVLGEENTSSPHPIWRKATEHHINNYRRDLKHSLDSIALNNGILCNDPNCSSNDHHNDLDVFCNNIINAIDLAVNTNIPSSVNKSNTSKNVVPGWSMYVKPYKDDARFWHAIWVSLGRPLNNEIHRVMKHTRNVYHYAVRRVKKQKIQIEQDNMLASFLDGKVPNLINELKKQRASSNTKAASHIDGQVGNENISNHFASKYSEIYNTNETVAETDLLLNNLNISDNDMSIVELVSPQIVYQAISCINSDKNDNMYNFKSNAFLNAADVLNNHLTLLFQSFLIHGYVPNELITCNLKPIVKDKLGDKLSSENYRAIGISSLILKILDWVIFILFESQLKPSDLQFGFQKKNSTTMCSWLVIETVNYFNNRDTPVFACFLDLTKAFDLVKFSDLFNKLKNKISAVFIRLLAYIYIFQSCCVEWCGFKSKYFNVSNGIRQGAVLSPILFSLYIDDLFIELASSGFGCYIKDLFYGIIGYADDIVLLSPDKYGLQCMLDITNSFLTKLGLKISVDHLNPKKSKTKCVAFGLKNKPSSIILNGTSLPWCDSYKHLGHTLYKDGTLKLDVDFKRQSFIGTFHELRQELKCPYPIVFLNLIIIYMSHFYGSNLWNLFDIDSVLIAWNNIIRNVFNLPRRSHRYLIEPMSESPHVLTLLTNRFLKFYNSLYCSPKKVISNLRKLQEVDCRSTFGNNINRICRLNNTLDISQCSKNSVKYFPINKNDIWRVNILKELIRYDQKHPIQDFSENDIQFIIENVACE